MSVFNIIPSYYKNLFLGFFATSILRDLEYSTEWDQNEKYPFHFSRKKKQSTGYLA